MTTDSGADGIPLIRNSCGRLLAPGGSPTGPTGSQDGVLCNGEGHVMGSVTQPLLHSHCYTATIEPQPPPHHHRHRQTQFRPTVKRNFAQPSCACRSPRVPCVSFLVLGTSRNRSAWIWGKSHRLWASVGRTAGSQGESFVGIPADVIADMVNPLKEGRPVEYKTLGLRLEYLSLSQLRKMGW
jgi:hypothetical protein